MKNDSCGYEDGIRKIKHQHSYVETEGVGVYRLPVFCTIDGVTHGFSTRVGGVSIPPYDSMNLCWTRDYCDENIYRNYDIFCRACGIRFEDMVIVNHQHGSRVERVDSADKQRGFPGKREIPCDGLVTNDNGIVLVTSHADCGAMFFHDPVTRSIGLCHAGWRGTIERIGAEVVRMMGECYGARPENIIAGTGPCICRDCFEVDEKLGVDFVDEFGFSEVASDFSGGKAHVDLQLCSAVQLLDAGVLPEHIYLSDICTYEDEAHLFSYRRDRGNTGSMIAYLKLM